jgi:hypothetical protein
MGILDRLGTVIKSYLNDDETPLNKAFGKQVRHSLNDPDFDDAYEELNDFLRGNASNAKKWKEEKENAKNGGERERPVTDETKRDFAELGLTSEASWEECKEAYKKLLKIHHPDRHAKHEGNMNKATDKTTRVNTAYERLKKHFLS